MSHSVAKPCADKGAPEIQAHPRTQSRSFSAVHASENSLTLSSPSSSSSSSPFASSLLLSDVGPIPCPQTIAPFPFYRHHHQMSMASCANTSREFLGWSLPIGVHERAPALIPAAIMPPKHEAVPLLESDEPDATERKCTQEAVHLLEQCILRSPELDRFRLNLLLGFGTFGMVMEAETREHPSSKVAIKIMRKAQIHASRMITDPREGYLLPLEIALLKYKPVHPNLVSYICSWDDEECWYLVTDLGGHPWRQGIVDLNTSLPFLYPEHNVPSPRKPSGYSRRLHVQGVDPNLPPQSVVIPVHSNNHSLAGYLRACGAYSGGGNGAGGESGTSHHESGFSDTSSSTHGPVVHPHVQLHIFQQIVDAVQTLHHHGIVHKDLKDENVLVDKQLRVKLIDFGHAAFYRTPNANPHISMFKSYGTPLFASPEVRSRMKYIGPEGDVYALGLMLYEMNYGDLPENLEEAVYECGGETLFDMSDRAGFLDHRIRDLCAWMLCPDPVIRPNIDQVAEHLRVLAQQYRLTL